MNLDEFVLVSLDASKCTVIGYFIFSSLKLCRKGGGKNFMIFLMRGGRCDTQRGLN